MVQENVVKNEQVSEGLVGRNQDHVLTILYQLFEVVYANLIDPKSFEGVSEYLLALIRQ